MRLDPRVRNFFMRVSQANSAPLPSDQIALFRLFRFGDTEARALLGDLADAGPSMEGVLVLFAALKYLEGREKYACQASTCDIFGVQRPQRRRKDTER